MPLKALPGMTLEYLGPEKYGEYVNGNCVGEYSLSAMEHVIFLDPSNQPGGRFMAFVAHKAGVLQVSKPDGNLCRFTAITPGVEFTFWESMMEFDSLLHVLTQEELDELLYHHSSSNTSA
jgi:hypothetical protein